MTESEQLKLKKIRKQQYEEWIVFSKIHNLKREFHVFDKNDIKRMLEYLEKLQYSRYVIGNYRRILNKLDGYYYIEGIDTFSWSTAEDFIKSEIPKSQEVSVRNIITRYQTFLSTGRITTKRVSKYKKELLSPELEKILKNYRYYNKKKRNHPLTISKKEKLSREFLRRCNCKTIKEITPERIAESVVNTTNKDEWIYAKQFFKFCLETKKIRYEYSALIPKQQKSEKLPTTYTLEEISKIEFSVDRTSSFGKRDYALLLLATRLGMRSSDIVDLKLSDINFKQKTIKRIQIKTGKEIELFLVKEVEFALIDYIENARPKTHYQNVFLRNYAPHKPFSTAVLRNGVVKKYILQSKVDITNKKHGPHALRSSLATSMVNNSVPFEAVSKILGHSTAETLNRYAKLSLDNLRQCAVEVVPASGKFEIWLSGGSNG